MRNRQSLVLATLIGLAVASTAHAQERKVGVTMGYPASVGILWHVTPTIAVRPEFAFAHSSSETDSNSSHAESSTTNVGTGVSVLFYLKKYESLRTYFVPRFSWAHTSGESDLSSFTNSTSETTGDSTSLTGSFGAQYSLGDRFAAFGEVGFGYSHNTTESSTSTLKLTGNAWATRTGVGVIFYF